MKKILFLTCIYINIITPAIPDTMNVNWMVDGSVYNTSTCTVGGDIILPTTPTKRGYTFLGWSATTIPTTEYTPIEYIESTGTQYIDTGFAPNQDTRVVMEYLVPSNNAIGSIFGSRCATNDRMFTFLYTGAYRVAFGYGYRSTGNTGPVARYDSKLMVDINKNHCDLYDESTTNIWSTDLNSVTFQTCNELVFPGWISGGTYSNNTFTSGILLYSFKLYDDGTLIRDFIPVLDPNGVACMYDTVSGEYFYNAGTGDFVAGPAI